MGAERFLIADAGVEKPPAMTSRLLPLVRGARQCAKIPVSKIELNMGQWSHTSSAFIVAVGTRAPAVS